ncbi:MAG: DNA gyrase subunit A, partial [Bacteroidetes bacterium]|nr:DNA gyrase subunit A [Bacteroidota bacterium]
KGVKTLNITDKTGAVIAVKDVTDSDDLMIINRSGVIIRMAVVNLRVMGRATQGVRLIKIDDGDSIAAVAKVDVEVAPEIVDEMISESIDGNNEIIHEEPNEPIVNDKTEDAGTEN